MAKKKTKTGRPKLEAGKAKARFLQVRLQNAEANDFATAAELAGIPLSTWVRERLRIVAKRELKEHGRPVGFLPDSP
jgi:hypothetical protein